MPVRQWGLDELTYCALFFHPSLDVARAQWRATQASGARAAQRLAPTLNGNLAHSDDPDPSKKPFAFGLSIDIPIVTANKREIRIENAQHLSKAAKLKIAQIAWQLRNNIAQTLTEYAFNETQLHLLHIEELRHEEIVNIYQKRVSVGVASNIELSNAKLRLQTISSTVNSAQQTKLILLSKLASNIGVPLANVVTMSLDIDQKRPEYNLTNTELQTTTLLNRLDIRIALERYAAAEAKLKLEIAGQYPDLVISPGAAYEFGDNIWSLGLSGLLSLLNKNKVAIAEATMLREVEAAQFEDLQTKVILEANIANAEVIQAKKALENQQRLLAQQQSNTQRMQRKFTAGDIDRLEMTYAQLEVINAEKNVALANFQLNKSLDQLENTLQKPLASEVSASSKSVNAAFNLEGEK
ncbi:MAG: TolC family protein [Methylotenera sp.]|uniref:TolC family protein n=1 Tax=Methylotenera sp. TaxID=2051956 RepID=UPI00248764D8|nr:TolC family protein [Methylotenera sp.]MDI1309578.1 TolC family protein [Methylotenera sp.]